MSDDDNDGFDIDKELKKMLAGGKATMKKNCEDLFEAYSELKEAGFGDPQAMYLLSVLMGGGSYSG